MNKIKYPYARPYIRKSDKIAIERVLSSQYLTDGNELVKFEKNLKKKTNSNYTLACNSGTAALHLIYKSIGLSNSHIVLTSPLTFIATANAAKMCGAKVIFCDVDQNTGLMTADLIEKSILKNKRKIKVITVVHLGGRVCNMQAIYKIAKKYGCLLIEDACHAIGANYKGIKGKDREIGSCKFSLAASFSFHAIKNITSSEGGAVTTNNKDLYDKMKLYRSHNLEKNLNKIKGLPEKNALWYYQAKDIGWNYRLNEISSALGNSQLNYLKSNLLKREKLVSYYIEFLKGIELISLPKLEKNKFCHAWHLYSVQINFKKLKKTRGQLMKELLKYGIGSQVHYIPLFLQPIYMEKQYNNFKNTINYYSQTLSLPLYVQLKKSDIVYISDKLRKLMKN